jgi:hypothetical protein
VPQWNMDGAGEVILLVFGAGEDLHQLRVVLLDQPADLVAMVDLTRHHQFSLEQRQ